MDQFESTDHYTVLGVKDDASTEEIKVSRIESNSQGLIRVLLSC